MAEPFLATEGDRFHMWEGRNHRRENRRLEELLRGARPQPPDELIRDISAQLAPSRQPRVWSRMAFAAAFTTLLVGMFASFGGIGYAASSATEAIQTVKKLSSASPVPVRSAASDQYPGPPAGEVQEAEAAQQQAAAAPAAAAAEAGSLPFTGISLLATVAISLAMIAIGLILRRRERSES